MFDLPLEAEEPGFTELFAYWQNCGPPGLLPGRRHIDPLHLPRDLLPRIILLDVVRDGGPPRFRFRLAGTHFVELCGGEPRGRFADELDLTPDGDKLIGALRAVLTTGAPALYIAPLTLPTKERSWSKRLALPLAADGRTIDMVLATYALLRPDDWPVQASLVIFERSGPRPPGFVGRAARTGSGWRS